MSFTVNKTLLVLLLAIGACVQLCAQIAPRVSGLEKNSEYMALLKQEHELQIKEDSVENLVSKGRILFRDNPDQRTKYGAEILKLEGALFDIRNNIGLLESKISAIEQEFVINNLDNYTKPTVAPASRPRIDTSSVQHADLTANDFFRQNLPQKDYAALLHAQKREISVTNYIKIFIRNYTTIRDINDKYQTVEKTHIADSLYSKYRTLNTLNEKISDSITAVWIQICDNKSYAYSYLFDKMNQSEILSNQEKAVASSRQNRASVRGKYASDALADYATSKKMILDYELQLAETLGITPASDSLKKAITEVASMELILPKISITERYFIDYQDIEILARTPYNTAHPMPKCVVYPRGVIYRILLGSYTKAQAPSIFKGVTPIAYIYGADRRHNYYAGGFQALAHAENAVDQLMAAGFKRPEIVVWENGIAKNYTKENLQSPTDKSESATLYRIEIKSQTSDLPANIKQLIAEQGNGAEISRIANSTDSEYQFTFIIGTFDSQSIASKLSDAILERESSLRVKVTAIEN